MALKAYWINDCECYAGTSVQEAVLAAMSDSGNDRDFYDDEAEIVEASDDEKVNINGCDGEEAEYSTIGEMLKKMSAPGMVCTTEW